MTAFQDNIRLPSDIFSFLQKNHHGEVLLTTSKGIYLQFSSRILLLAPWSYGLTPIGMGLSRFVDFAIAVAPKAGQTVSVLDGRLHFPGGILIPVWEVVDPSTARRTVLPAQLYNCATLLLNQCSERSLAMLSAPLLLNEPLPPAGQNNPYCTRALPIIERLLQSLADPSPEAVEEHVCSLLGLGLGLTPSLDDILLGMVYGLLRLAPHEASASALRRAIAAHASSHTNTISAAYLGAVAQGAYFERLEDVLAGLCSNTPLDITSILEIGSSSGSEMLLGLLLAVKITLKG